MASLAKTKTRAANIPVAQSRDEAASYVAQIGALQRELLRKQTDMNDGISKLKEDAEAAAEPLRQRIAALTEGTRIWAEANRMTLTNNGQVKFSDIGTGLLKWRMRPPKVSLPRDMAGVVERIKTLGLLQFLRVTEEPSKEAMLADPDTARAIPGVRICSAGEDFVVEPFEAEIAK